MGLGGFVEQWWAMLVLWVVFILALSGRRWPNNDYVRVAARVSVSLVGPLALVLMILHGTAKFWIVMMLNGELSAGAVATGSVLGLGAIALGLLSAVDLVVPIDADSRLGLLLCAGEIRLKEAAGIALGVWSTLFAVLAAVVITSQ